MKLSADTVEAMCRSIYGPTWDGPRLKQPGDEMKKVWRTHVRDMIARQPLIVRKAIQALLPGEEA